MAFLYLFSVLSRMNIKYRAILIESKKLNGSGLLQKASASNITADKILYDHAIRMVIYKKKYQRIHKIIKLTLLLFSSVKRQL